MAIGEFQRQHRFLSNFFPCRIEYLAPRGGLLIFHSTEAFFQAMKTLDWGDRRRIAAMRNPPARLSVRRDGLPSGPTGMPLRRRSCFTPFG